MLVSPFAKTFEMIRVPTRSFYLDKRVPTKIKVLVLQKPETSEVSVIESLERGISQKESWVSHTNILVQKCLELATFLKEPSWKNHYQPELKD